MTALVTLATRVLIALARPLPLPALRGLGAIAGWLWYRVVPIRRAVARENLQRALGLSAAAAEPLVREMYLHLGRSAAELLALERVAVDLRVAGEPGFREALARGRGVLLVTAHLGNWEVLVRAATAAGRPVHVLTKRLHRGWAEAAWRALRRGGASLLHEKGSGRAVLAALRRGEVVACVLDQHEPSASAHVGPFFGRPAATSTGLARLALATGAPVVPVFTWRAPEGAHCVEFGALIEAEPTAAGRDAAVDAMTRRCLSAIEAAVRAHPGQWLWIHRRWKVEAAVAGLTPAGVSPAGPGRPRGRGRASARAATRPEPGPDAPDALRPPRG